MSDDLKDLVRRRAGHCCEYCRLPEDGSGVEFEIDHILAKKHGGETTADNLALSCVYCNGFKGPNMAGTDPATGLGEFLFNPRIDPWTRHFAWHGAEIVGLTSIGRATIRTLKMNNEAALNLRTVLAAEGRMRFEA